jgi:hypothetical protein
MDAETFVLVVGGGPVGLAAAIELAWRCVPAILVNDGIETAQHPKCNNTNARYTPLDRPGARAPHFWLAPGRAVYDELGKAFTVLDFGAAGGADAVAMAAQARNVPLKILRLERPESLYRSRLVLVRPDQHIAWHGDAVSDPMAIIDRVRGA